MKKPFNRLQYSYTALLDLIICIPFLAIPLILDLPYRVNIFLSWEGSYRMMLGQIPFEDFGLPLGFGYWLVPTFFFKILGPELVTLVKAQVFINAISLLSIRGILNHLKIKPLLVSLGLLTFCLTYVLFNFWPWYNHSVIVYELVALFCLVRYLNNPNKTAAELFLALGGLFMFISFFNKQDGGAMGFFIGLLMLGYHASLTKKFKPLLIYVITFFLFGFVMVAPFLDNDFLYWFNYGQPPHNSRIGILKLAEAFFSTAALWEKSYLTVIILFLIALGKSRFKNLLQDSNLVLLGILTICLLGQAIVTRVTSPLPTDHMTFFHAFAIVFIFHLADQLYENIEKVQVIIPVTILVICLFSGGYWKYIKGVLHLSLSREDATVERISDPWIKSKVNGFKGVLMPQETVKGIDNLLSSDIAQKENLTVLNMSELTPLALELGYTPPTDQPLWYHLNVGIFQRGVDTLCARVSRQEYDIVLFQDIPNLEHFFPYEVRDSLRNTYQLQDSFLAPRKMENSTVEVYVRK
ncbi:MAG: hypothetical protein RIC35_04855 [Marinoscillum sp.]